MQGIRRQECASWREKLRVMSRKRWSCQIAEESEIGRVTATIVVLVTIISRIVGTIWRYTLNGGGLEIRELSSPHRAEHAEERKWKAGECKWKAGECKWKAGEWE